MRVILISAYLMFFSLALMAQRSNSASENIAARQMYQDMKFAMFIQWGPYSVLGNGEWVMQNTVIKKNDYSHLIRAFYPVDFDAAKWVAMAKSAGMNYIKFTTRHHDGFSNYNKTLGNNYEK